MVVWKDMGAEALSGIAIYRTMRLYELGIIKRLKLFNSAFGFLSSDSAEI